MSSSIVHSNLNAAGAMPHQLVHAAVRPQRPASVQSQPAQAQTEQRVEVEDDDDDEGRFRIAWFWQPSWLVSMLFHVIVLLALALITLSPPVPEQKASILAKTDLTDELVEEFNEELLALTPETAESEPHESTAAAELLTVADALAASQVELPDLAIGELTQPEPAMTQPLFDPSDLSEELVEIQDNSAPVEFYGSRVRGKVAVVFDVTASMYGSIPAVLKEIERKFSRAQVVVVHGATFMHYGSARLLPYRQNPQVYQYMLKNTQRSPANLPKLAKVQRELLSLKRCDSLPAEGLLQSLGTAVEALLNQYANLPSTIFVFSDFQDGIDPKYMLEIQQLAIRNQVKIVVCNPTKFKKDRAAYEAFAKATGGQLRESLPK